VHRGQRDVVLGAGLAEPVRARRELDVLVHCREANRRAARAATCDVSRRPEPAG
jgi:hypothetical protein